MRFNLAFDEDQRAVYASALALVLACASTGACSSSSHETSDAASRNDAPSRDGGTRDSDLLDATLDTADGNGGPPPPVFTLEAGVTWTDLYRDYFGNDTQLNTAGCSSGVQCHGTPTSGGAAQSNYVCPMADKEACYQSITSQLSTGPGLIQADASFANDYLSQVLCAVNDAGEYVSGEMPIIATTGECKYYFTPTDMERLRLWVQAGYPDN
jgi:hypothetical protein